MSPRYSVPTASGWSRRACFPAARLTVAVARTAPACNLPVSSSSPSGYPATRPRAPEPSPGVPRRLRAGRHAGRSRAARPPRGRHPCSALGGPSRPAPPNGAAPPAAGPCPSLRPAARTATRRQSRRRRAGAVPPPALLLRCRRAREHMHDRGRGVAAQEHARHDRDMAAGVLHHLQHRDAALDHEPVDVPHMLHADPRHGIRVEHRQHAHGCAEEPSSAASRSATRVACSARDASCGNRLVAGHELPDDTGLLAPCDEP